MEDEVAEHKKTSQSRKKYVKKPRYNIAYK
jgi:hypothetical protein